MAIYTIIYKRVKVSNNSVAALNNHQSAIQYALDNCYGRDDLWREKCYAIYVDRQNRPISHLLIGEGGFDNVSIDIKLILKAALDSNANGIILLHNHPSGNPNPSSKDIENTFKLKKACAAFDIHLIDHLVLGENNYFSFNEEVVKTYPRPIAALYA